MKIHVRVVEAENLPKMDYFFGSIDPYCILYLDPERSQEKRTTVKNRDKHPKWNEDFHFTIKDFYDQSLVIILKDKDTFSSDDNVSKLHFPLKNFEQSKVTDKWYTLIPYKNVKRGGRIRLLIHIGPITEKPFNPDIKINVNSDLSARPNNYYQRARYSTLPQSHAPQISPENIRNLNNTLQPTVQQSYSHRMQMPADSQSFAQYQSINTDFNPNPQMQPWETEGPIKINQNQVYSMNQPVFVIQDQSINSNFNPNPQKQPWETESPIKINQKQVYSMNQPVFVIQDQSINTDFNPNPKTQPWETEGPIKINQNQVYSMNQPNQYQTIHFQSTNYPTHSMENSQQQNFSIQQTDLNNQQQQNISMQQTKDKNLQSEPSLQQSENQQQIPVQQVASQPLNCQQYDLILVAPVQQQWVLNPNQQQQAMMQNQYSVMQNQQQWVVFQNQQQVMMNQTPIDK